jgi:hypothetical protein
VLSFNFEVGRLGFDSLEDATVGLQNHVAAASAAASSLLPLVTF